MKVLLFNGSPNEFGCTYTALSKIAESINRNGIETEIIHVGKNVVTGCIGCKACAKLGKCVYEDVLNTVLDKIESADGYVFGSPVHYAGASGNLTSFMDRLFITSGAKMKFKPAAAIFSTRRGGITAALDQINKYFMINQMPIVSSTYWNGVHGNTPDEVLRDEEGIQVMEVMGENMSWLLKCIESGKNSGICLPEQKAKIKTNYIR